MSRGATPQLDCVCVTWPVPESYRPVLMTVTLSGGHFTGAGAAIAGTTPQAVALAAPLGCGVQTGAGAVLNALRVEAGTSVLVLGAGSVGLSAVMAAGLADAADIIVVEPIAARRASVRSAPDPTRRPPRLTAISPPVEGLAGPGGS